VVIDLLAEDAIKAKEIAGAHRPAMSKNDYLRFQREQAEVIRFDGGG
jgi:hypothetical protein